MRRWAEAAALALAFAAGCGDDALSQGPNACVAAGGRCVAQATSGANVGLPACAAGELSFPSPPQLCDDVSESCCFKQCPSAQPSPGDACDAENRSCQYRDATSCVQAICISGTWWLAVSECRP